MQIFKFKVLCYITHFYLFLIYVHTTFGCFTQYNWHRLDWRNHTSQFYETKQQEKTNFVFNYCAWQNRTTQIYETKQQEKKYFIFNCCASQNHANQFDEVKQQENKYFDHYSHASTNVLKICLHSTGYFVIIFIMT